MGWYIDGFNLYHALAALNDPALKWLDLSALARSYLRSDQRLVRTVYSTAVNTWDPGKRARHRAYLSALQVMGVEVLAARFDKTRKYCRKHERYCVFNEEKQSDVNLAVASLSDAFEANVDTVNFLTADSDQVPTFRTLREKFPSLRLNLIAPPGRLSHARELGAWAHAVFELTPGRLARLQLPDVVLDAAGTTVCTRPAEYTRSP